MKELLDNKHTVSPDEPFDTTGLDITTYDDAETKYTTTSFFKYFKNNKKESEQTDAEKIFDKCLAVLFGPGIGTSTCYTDTEFHALGDNAAIRVAIQHAWNKMNTPE